jgi:hypothetical protein
MDTLSAETLVALSCNLSLEILASIQCIQLVVVNLVNCFLLCFP